jgi:signal transduction histidine kinase
MSSKAAPERLSNHPHRAVTLISFLLILIYALRRRYDLVEPYTIELLFVLLVLFTVLLASEPFISRRIKSYYRIYFVLQIIIVEILGIFQEYQDTWAWLYFILGLQVATHSSRKEAWVWYSLFTALLLVTLSVEFGFISGLGRAMAYAIMGLLVISTDIQYASHEDSLAESQMLVSELQEANQKLVEYAAQAQELAVLQERNRMIQELYDSVGQKIFAIQLSAETARLMLEKDPLLAAGQIDDLLEQTQSTLGQMRQLIDQWRPI